MGATQRFQRLELKYHLTEPTAERLRRAAMPWCVPDVHNQGAAGYPIASLYLDSPGLEFHHARARKDQDRFKLRIRTYGAAPLAHLEIKRKVGKVVHKKRVAVPRHQAAAIAKGADSGDSIGRESGDDAIGHFQALRARCGAEPKVGIFYTREAYVSTVDDYARITFDRGICAAAMEPNDWTLHDSPPPRAMSLDRAGKLPDGVSSSVLLELKCVTLVPTWMRQLIHDFELTSTGFSKYSHGVERAGLAGPTGRPLWRP
jgi:hypothetical protein